MAARGIHIFTPMKIAEARKLIAKRFNDKMLATHFGCDRSSIVRMRQREGIDSTVARGHRDGRKHDTPMLNKMRKRMAGISLPTDSKYLTSTVWLPLEGTTPISIMDLPNSRFTVCRWPVEGGYCGQPSGGRTYCDHHHAIAYKGRAK